MKETADLRLIRNGLSAQFEAVADGEVRGLLAYDRTGWHYDLRHTFVPEEFRGLGIAGALVEGVLELLDAEHVTISSTCAFVASFIAARPEFQHLVAAATSRHDPTDGTRSTASPPERAAVAAPPRQLKIPPRVAREQIDIEPFRILTARLILRPWDTDDIDDAMAIYSDHLVARWTWPALPEVVDRPALEALLKSWIKESDTSPYPRGRWAIELAETGVVVGGVALTRVSQGDARLLISWQIAPDAVGHGLGTEATHAIAHQAFQAGGATEIYAAMHRTNMRAMGTAARLGMRPAGQIDAFFGVELDLFRLGKAEIDRPNDEI